MAYAEISTPVGKTISGVAGKGFLANLFDAYARRKVYTNTVRELSGLSGRELSDLGLSRSGIRRAALEAAYGKNV